LWRHIRAKRGQRRLGFRAAGFGMTRALSGGSPIPPPHLYAAPNTHPRHTATVTVNGILPPLSSSLQARAAAAGAAREPGRLAACPLSVHLQPSRTQRHAAGTPAPAPAPWRPCGGLTVLSGNRRSPGGGGPPVWSSGSCGGEGAPRTCGADCQDEELAAPRSPSAPESGSGSGNPLGQRRLCSSWSPVWPLWSPLR